MQEKHLQGVDRKGHKSNSRGSGAGGQCLGYLQMSEARVGQAASVWATSSCLHLVSEARAGGRRCGGWGGGRG